MEANDCDQFSLIPQGCFKCGEKAMEYCDLNKDTDITTAAGMIVILAIYGSWAKLNEIDSKSTN